MSQKRRKVEKKVTLLVKLVDWKTGIEGEHPALGPLGLLKTVGPRLKQSVLERT